MKKLLTLLAMLLLLMTWSCGSGGDDVVSPDDGKTEKPDDAYITLNKENITFAPDGESIDIKVYSNYAWKLTNNCDWVTTSVTNGEASEEGVTVTLTADVAYDDREGTITFSCGKAKKLLVVSQSLKEVIIADENNTFNLPVEGGTVEIAYQTTVECEVVIPKEAQSWISLADDTKALVSEKATLIVAENTICSERSTIVKVVKVGDNTLFAEYTISQTYNDVVIEYTTADSMPVAPNDRGFDAKIIRNEYIDGKGYIYFDAQITMIGERAFAKCTSLTSITIPDSVTSIAEYAFAYCTSLESVTIPNSVTSIGEGAFGGCISLESVTIPNSVTEIGENAFWHCCIAKDKFINNSSLDAETNYYWGAILCDIIQEDGLCIIDTTVVDCRPNATSVVIPNSITEIGADAFMDCTSLESVTIPNSVTSIGEWAFSVCTSLTSITIPESVTEIGEGAFGGCRGELIINSKVVELDYNNTNYPADSGWLDGAQFTKLTIGESVTKIGDSTFRDCTSLKSITIPNSVTEIGNYAFADCISLESVTIPNSVTEIGEGAFYDCRGELIIDTDALGLYGGSFTKLTIGNSVTKIKACAFMECTSLESVTIPNSVTEIGEGAFGGCTSLTSITIPESVTEIGDQAFAGCSSLTSITIPNSVTSIGGGAFMVCTSLKSVTIPNSVTSIAEYAFAYCTSLISVYCKPTTPPAGGIWMFDDNASGRKIYVPITSVDDYKKADYWSEYADYIVGYDFE